MKNTGKVYIVAPDPLFIDPINGKCSKKTIFEAGEKWADRYGEVCFLSWQDAFDFTHNNCKTV